MTLQSKHWLLLFTPFLGVVTFGCSEPDYRLPASKDRTEAFWKNTQECLAPLEHGFRDPNQAREASKKLRELTGSAATVNQPDSDLVKITRDLASTLNDYGDLIEGHQIVSKLALTQQANQEERDAFVRSVMLFGTLDEKFYRLQDRLEKHRGEMEKRFQISLTPHKHIRQQFMVSTAPPGPGTK